MGSVNWSELKALILRHSSFVICSHVRPDADALGSEIGLQYLIRSLGRTATIVNASAVPSTIAFMTAGQDVLQLNVDVTKQQLTLPDAFLTVDTSSWQQLGAMADLIRSSGVEHIVIDHHLASDEMGPNVFRDTTAAAAAEMVCRLFEEFETEPDATTADFLYAGIATDTGWFRFPSTRSETMRLAGRLIDFGARPHEMYRLIHEQMSLERVQLSGKVLASIRTAADGRLNWLQVSAADMEATGTSPADTEGLVNRCLTVAGAELAFIAVELPTTQIKFSLRCREPHNVAELAGRFSGGGHQLASGCTLYGPLETAVQKVLSAAHEIMGTAASANDSQAES